MKYSFPLFILIITLGTACSSGSPRSVAKGFLSALQSKDCEKAKKFCTPQSEQTLSMMCLMVIQANKSTEFEILRDSIAEDHAWVFYKSITENGTVENSLDVVKTSEGWRVDLGSSVK